MFYPGALAKVSFADDRDPMRRRLTALLNPTELSTPVNARIGRLNPVGWSSDTKQYASTESPSFGLNLEFTYEAYANLGIKSEYPEYNYAYKFFMSFLHGPRPGVAPSHLRLIWPNVLSMICIVENVTPTFRRFYQDLKVADYAVSMQLSENGMDFISSQNVLEQGLQRLPGTSERRGASNSHADTGRPLRIVSPAGTEIV